MPMKTGIGIGVMTGMRIDQHLAALRHREQRTVYRPVT